MAMPRPLRNILIILAGVLLVSAVLIGALYAYDKVAQPYVITNALKEHMNQPALFSTRDLVAHNVDGPVNLMGDETLSGDYKLSSDKVTKLLSRKPLFNCGDTNKDCTVTDQGTQDNGYYCEDAHENGHDVNYGICVDPQEDIVRWVYYFY